MGIALRWGRDLQKIYKQDLYSAMDNLKVEEGDKIEGRWTMIKEAFVKPLEESVGKKTRCATANGCAQKTKTLTWP